MLEPEKHGVFNEQKTQLALSGKFRQHRAAEDVELIYQSFGANPIKQIRNNSAAQIHSISDHTQPICDSGTTA